MIPEDRLAEIERRCRIYEMTGEHVAAHHVAAYGAELAAEVRRLRRENRALRDALLGGPIYAISDAEIDDLVAALVAEAEAKR